MRTLRKQRYLSRKTINRYGKSWAKIERQTDYLFVYSEKEVDVNQRKTVNVSQQRVADVLSSLFRSTNVGYAMEGHNIMLMAKTTQTDAAQQKRHITGVVKDIKGETIIGANIMIKGTGTGVSTNIDGEFSIEAAAGEELIVSFHRIPDTNYQNRFTKNAQYQITGRH